MMEKQTTTIIYASQGCKASKRRIQIRQLKQFPARHAALEHNKVRHDTTR